MRQCEFERSVRGIGVAHVEDRDADFALRVGNRQSDIRILEVVRGADCVPAIAKPRVAQKRAVKVAHVFEESQLGGAQTGTAHAGSGRVAQLRKRYLRRVADERPGGDGFGDGGGDDGGNGGAVDAPAAVPCVRRRLAAFSRAHADSMHSVGRKPARGAGTAQRGVGNPEAGSGNGGQVVDVADDADDRFVADVLRRAGREPPHGGIGHGQNPRHLRDDVRVGGVRADGYGQLGGRDCHRATASAA